MKRLRFMFLMVSAGLFFVNGGTSYSQDPAKEEELVPTDTVPTDATDVMKNTSSKPVGGISGSFNICEVQGISYSDMNVNLLCYQTGTHSKSWITCEDMEKGCPKPQPAPIFVKCPDSATLSAEVTRLRFKVAANAGTCGVQPISPQKVTIYRVKDISFVYMALKDGLVLSDVSVSNGELVKGTLIRDERLSERAKMEARRWGDVMKESARGPAQGMPAGGMVKPTQDQVCVMQTNSLNTEKDMLEAQLESFTQARSDCQSLN